MFRIRRPSAFAVLILILLLAGGIWLAPGSLPSNSDLRPPDADHPLRLETQKFERRPDLMLKVLDNHLQKKSLPPNQFWWALYKKAQIFRSTDPQKSCDIFRGLAGDKKFPLTSLATLNTKLTCETTEPEPKAKNEKWMEERQLETALALAKQNKNYSEVADILVRKSKLSMDYHTKLNLMLEAQQLASRHKLKTLKYITNRLYLIFPSLHPRPSRYNYLSVAEDFKKRRMFDSAAKYYQRVIWRKAFTKDQKIRAYKGLRHLYRLQLDNKTALQTTRDLERFTFGKGSKKRFTTKFCETYADANILLARTEWTEENAEAGKRVLQKLIKNCSRRTSLSEAHWILGRMSEERQDYEQALVHYKSAKAELTRQSPLAEKVLWSAAWAHYKKGLHDEALAAFEHLATAFEGGLSVEKYLFWLAMTYKAKGETQKAEKIFADIHEEYPLSFYGFLAQRELGRSFVKEELLSEITQQKKRRLPRVLISFFDPNYFEWLVAMDEKNVARKYLTSVSTNLSASSAKDDLSAWVYVLNQFSRIDSYSSVFEKIEALEEDIRQKILRKHHHLIFPKPYHKAVLSSAARFGVSPEYIYAIMRQESAFNPDARSPMDAFGLMQLLPQIAENSARKYGIQFSDESELFDPETSILLGASHLRDLLDRHKGKLVLAIASYNAKEDAIQNWMKTRYRGNTLEFIEDIPYEETQSYVKLVLRNLYIYSLFQNETSDSKFPEWTLAME